MPLLIVTRVTSFLFSEIVYWLYCVILCFIDKYQSHSNMNADIGENGRDEMDLCVSLSEQIIWSKKTMKELVAWLFQGSYHYISLFHMCLIHCVFVYANLCLMAANALDPLYDCLDDNLILDISYLPTCSTVFVYIRITFHRTKTL